MGRPKLEVPDRFCAFCLKQLVRKWYDGRLESRFHFGKRKFCGFVCMAKGFVGRDRGGRSPTRMRTEARELVPLRVCDKCKLKTGVHVHHIDENPLNNALDNLERLCVKCHRGKHAAIRVCIVCGDKHKGKGYCQKHYQRIQRHGDHRVIAKSSGRIVIEEDRPQS
jgi:hypothetical protein